MPREKAAKRPKLAREGVSGRLHYFVERALINIRQNILVNVLTIVTISLAFLILSLFLLVYVNLERVTASWSDRVQITAYFERDLSPVEVSDLTRKIKAIPGTSDADYVSRDEAFKRFYGRLKGQESLLEGVSPEILPSSIEIRLERDSRDSQSLTAYLARLKRLPEIKEVQYGEEWVKRFNDFMNLIRFAGALVGGFIVLAVIFIVANTIKLTIYSRKDELELMGLVGATRMFIKAPFLIEGMLQGIAGAVMSLVILAGAYLAFLHNADIFSSIGTMESGLVFLPLPHMAALLLGGAALGVLGSLASLKKFIAL